MPREFPELAMKGGWDDFLRSPSVLEAVLPAFLALRRWFGGKNRQIRAVKIEEAIPIPVGESTVHMALLHVQYLENDPEVYDLPLASARGEEAKRILESRPHSVVARLTSDEAGVLYDATWDPAFSSALLESICRGESFAGSQGRLAAVSMPLLVRERGNSTLAPMLSQSEQSNTSIIFGDRYIMKLIRRLEDGVNPDLEISRFLSEQQQFPHSPPLAGYLEYRRSLSEPMTLAILQRFVPNRGTGWSYTLEALSQYLERIGTFPEDGRPPEPIGSVVDLRLPTGPPEVVEAIGPYIESVRLLGQRTAELHAALSAETAGPAFSLEPFSPAYQLSVYESMRTEAARVLQTLAEREKGMPNRSRELARQVLDSRAAILARFEAVASTRMTGRRSRIHGDYHLGQVLYTGSDFVIIDFEGEPSRSLSERRAKQSVLRDVAGMVRSFHYAAYTAVLGQSGHLVEAWCRYWYRRVARTFIRSYRRSAETSAFLPDTDAEFQTLLEIYIFSKAVYELGYELGHRPDWVSVPLLGILDILRTPDSDDPSDLAKGTP